MALFHHVLYFFCQIKLYHTIWELNTKQFFLGLGRYAPNAAVNGDMGWPAPEHRQWMCITR